MQRRQSPGADGPGKDTERGSPKRRVGEIRKQAEIVIDQLESEPDASARIEELEAGISKLIIENVHGRYRDILLDGWVSLASAIEEGENAESGVWSWLFKTQEAMDLVVGDLDYAGFFERESPPYVIAYDSFDLAAYAWATAGEPDDRARLIELPNDDRDALEKTMDTYRRVGESLGEIRVGVLGELEFEEASGQEYDAIEMLPTYGRFQGGSCGIVSEPGDCESGAFEGQILNDGIHLHYRADGDSDEWGLSFKVTPDDCREMAMSLMNIAADAEHSSEVDA